MLTAVRQHDGAKVIAMNVDKSGEPFLCTSCRRPLVLNKGRIRVHHVRHASRTVWFEPGGQARSQAPTTRISRRFRTPSAGPLVDLVRDFRPRVLPPFAGGTVDVPQRRLFVDRRPRWWQGVRPE